MFSNWEMETTMYSPGSNLVILKASQHTACKVDSGVLLFDPGIGVIYEEEQTKEGLLDKVE